MCLHYSQFTKENSERALNTTKPYGYWGSEKGNNMRAFFEKIAYNKDLDPQAPETWYSIPLREYKKYKVTESNYIVLVRHVYHQGVNSILARYRGSIIRALIDLFPQLKLDKTKFSVTPRNQLQYIFQ